MGKLVMFSLKMTLQTGTQIFFLTVGCNYYNKIQVPKLGALCKVMSRITRVPKQDHIRRNCWATFFKEPCLLAATCKKRDVSDMEKLLFLTAAQLNDAHIHLLFFNTEKLLTIILTLKYTLQTKNPKLKMVLDRKPPYNHGQPSERGKKVLFKTGSPLYMIKGLQKNCSNLHLNLITNIFILAS